MRQLSRLVRILAATVTHTFYLSLSARKLPPEKRAGYRAHRQQVGCALLCRIFNVTVTLEGEVPKGSPLLMVCNHFGVLDPLVLASQMSVSFVGKSELRQWPFVGWVTREMGLVFVDRESRSKTEGLIAEVREKLETGVPVLIFPEGTTNRSTEIMPFKTGGFEAVVGIKGARVLPLYLSVSEVEGRPADERTRQQVVWADSSQSFLEHFWGLLRLNRTHMHILAGEPIPVDGLDRKELARLSHAAVQRLSAEEER
jgi:lyso-ornithine lipid O-acyltransferase